MQRHERVEREFGRFKMGKLPHSTCKTEPEFLLDEMEDVGIDMPTSS